MILAIVGTAYTPEFFALLEANRREVSANQRRWQARLAHIEQRPSNTRPWSMTLIAPEDLAEMRGQGASVALIHRKEGSRD